MKGLSLKTRTDAAASVSLLRWLEQLRTEHARRILPITDSVALEWGRIAAGRPRNMADALIAATASVHHKIVVTRNIADFEDLGIPLIDPWNPTSG